MLISWTKQNNYTHICNKMNSWRDIWDLIYNIYCWMNKTNVAHFSRLSQYEPEKSRASLTTQHASKEHHLVINTSFVEPFNPIIGAQYIVLGEIETAQGKETLSNVVFLSHKHYLILKMTVSFLCCLFLLIIKHLVVWQELTGWGSVRVSSTVWMV